MSQHRSGSERRLGADRALTRPAHRIGRLDPSVSLVSQLDASTSPIRRFFGEPAANLAAVTGDVREQVRGCRTIHPGQAVPWGAVGSAINYRVAFSFPAAQPLVAEWGERAIEGERLSEAEVMIQGHPCSDRPSPRNPRPTYSGRTPGARWPAGAARSAPTRQEQAAQARGSSRLLPCCPQDA